MYSNPAIGQSAGRYTSPLSTAQSAQPGADAKQTYSLERLRDMPRPPREREVLDYGGKDDVRDFFVDGIVPKGAGTPWFRIVEFCVRQRLPQALSWLCVHGQIANIRMPTLSADEMHFVCDWASTYPGQVGMEFTYGQLGQHEKSILHERLKDMRALNRLAVQNESLEEEEGMLLNICLAVHSSPSISTLALHQCKMSADTVRELILHTRFGKLTAFEFVRVKLDRVHAITLLKGMREKENLLSLRFSGCDLGDEVAKGVADWLKKNPALRNLRIGSAGVGEVGAAYLARSLETNTNLESLELATNPIGDKGAIELAANLNKAKLKKLDLSTTELTAEGFEHIAKALASNNTITSFTVYCNEELGVRAAKAMADVLRNNSTLTELNFNFNRIGIEGARVLLDAMQVNPSVTSFALEDAGLDTAEGKAISAAIASKAAYNASMQTMRQLQMTTNSSFPVHANFSQ